MLTTPPQNWIRIAAIWIYVQKQRARSQVVINVVQDRMFKLELTLQQIICGGFLDLMELQVLQNDKHNLI